MYRVAKNTLTGEYIDDIITTDLVGLHPNCGLVILHTDPKKIMTCRSHKRIHEFLDENNIDIDLSCSSSPITLDSVKKAIEHDSFTTMRDIHDVVNLTLNKCPDVFYLGVGIIVNTESMNIIFSVCTGGRPFQNTPETLDTIKGWGVDAYIASGDSMRNLKNLADLVGIPVERVYDVATPQKKEWVIRHLKKQYGKVVMVGDGINDILALRAADKGVLSIQQTGSCARRLASEADVMITDIIQVVKIIKEMRNQ